MHPKKQQIKKQLRIFWKEFEWPLILSLGSLAFCLGIIGFQRYHFLTGKSYLLVDSIYQSLQLFSMNSGSVEPISGSSLPWELQVSRFLAPAVTAYAFLQAVLFLFQDRYTSWKLRQMQSHIIICGLGRKGFLLAQEFSKTYASVVVIEIDKNNSQIESCAESGILVLIGDGRDPTLLNKIGVQKAKYLISVCGDDGTNAEIAESARQIIRKGTNSKLICIIHIINPQLWTLLRERELEVKDNSFTLEFFNVYNSGARVLIRNTSPIQNIDYSKNILPHLLIVGLGWFAESLLVQIAQL